MIKFDEYLQGEMVHGLEVNKGYYVDGAITLQVFDSAYDNDLNNILDIEGMSLNELSQLIKGSLLVSNSIDKKILGYNLLPIIALFKVYEFINNLSDDKYYVLENTITFESECVSIDNDIQVNDNTIYSLIESETDALDLISRLQGICKYRELVGIDDDTYNTELYSETLKIIITL